MLHPVVCSPIITPVVDVLGPVAWQAGGSGQTLAQRLAALGARLVWPSALTDTGVLATVLGAAPTWSDTPTVTADGVVPGDGPSFTSSVTWADGGTRVVKFTADAASADITEPVEIGGGFWATSSGLEFRDGTNVASVATSWDVGDVVTGVVQVTDDGLMRVGVL